MESARTRLSEIAWLFLKLGTTAFGGPAAHLALMQDEVVTRRGWLTVQEFLDMYAATNFIPGPNSTEMAIHIGYRRAGWRGLVVAGSCFIVPAALMCTGLAAIYKAYGHNPASLAILWGVKPVVIAVVGQALWRLGKSAIKTWLAGSVAVLAAAALLVQLALLGTEHELLVLFGGGLAVALARGVRKRRFLPVFAWPLAPTTGAAATAAATTTAGAPLLSVFLIFLKIGSVLFGSGYVLLAFLQADFVDRNHWLTQTELLDSVAVGQVTPGPVFTTATFIGYLVAGPWGAVVATVGIFLPAFAFVALSAPILPRLRKSVFFGAFLDGLNAASLALMAVVLMRLAGDALGIVTPNGYGMDWAAAALAALSLIALLWKNFNSIWLLLIGAAVGMIRAWVLRKTGA
jgi:chromate transporter